MLTEDVAADMAPRDTFQASCDVVYGAVGVYTRHKNYRCALLNDSNDVELRTFIWYG